MNQSDQINEEEIKIADSCFCQGAHWQNSYVDE